MNGSAKVDVLDSVTPWWTSPTLLGDYQVPMDYQRFCRHLAWFAAYKFEAVFTFVISLTA